MRGEDLYYHRHSNSTANNLVPLRAKLLVLALHKWHPFWQHKLIHLRIQKYQNEANIYELHQEHLVHCRRQLGRNEVVFLEGGDVLEDF